MSRLSVITLFLMMSVHASAADKYTRVGHITDFKCPARVTIEKGYVPNPSVKVSPDRALVLSKILCPNKLKVTVFADSENYYITTLGFEPGTAYTRVVNGKTGKTSAIQGP